MISKLSIRRLLALAGVSLGALVLAVFLIVLLFGNLILNHYGRGRVERAFAEAHPGRTLRIGELDFSLSANRLVAQSIVLSSSGTTMKAGRASLTGVRWVRLLQDTIALGEILATASLDATNINVDFNGAHYGIRCARLRASVAKSELIAEGVELRPLMEDEAFFAFSAYRTPRFIVTLPECRVSGLEFAEVLEGRAYVARSVHISSPFMEALINRDKLPKPFVKSPPMMHEALAAIRQPLRIGSLTLTNGRVRYCERLDVGAEPAVLTIGSVSLSAEGIANGGDAKDVIQVRGQGDLMDAGKMKVAMTIPINPPDFSLHYSGSMGAMDLPRLDAFLNIAENTRISSGMAREAAFEIDVAGGHARGRVQGIYKDLEIALLDKNTGDDKGLNSRVASFFLNLLKIRDANTMDGKLPMKEGKVDYTRKPDDEFMQFVWFALRSGVLDIISH